MFLRGGESYDTRLTGAALRRVADWLDIADSETRVSVYPDMSEAEDDHKLALAWSWAAVLLANIADVDSVTIRTLANAINGIYDQETE